MNPQVPKKRLSLVLTRVLRGIVAFVAIAAVPEATSARERAFTSVRGAQRDIRALNSAMMAYYIDYTVFPQALDEGGEDLIPSSLLNKSGTYLYSYPTDTYKDRTEIGNYIGLIEHYAPQYGLKLAISYFVITAIAVALKIYFRANNRTLICVALPFYLIPPFICLRHAESADKLMTYSTSDTCTPTFWTEFPTHFSIANAHYAGKNTSYHYYTDGNILYMIHSIGPDLRRDIYKHDFEEYRRLLSENSTAAANNHMRELQYDPTNGASSRGDIIRMSDSAPY